MMTYELFKKLPIAIAGAVSILGAIASLPATAATFSFELQGVHYYGGYLRVIDTCENTKCGSGELRFDDSSLTGAAYEEVTLSNLTNSTFSFSMMGVSTEDAEQSLLDVVGKGNDYFQGIIPEGWSSNWDPIFQFQHGVLTGMTFDISGTFGEIAEWGFTTPYIKLIFNGDEWKLTQKVYTTSEGTVEFNVVEAWGSSSSQPVPEPASVAALGIIGTGLLLKRKKIEKA